MFHEETEMKFFLMYSKSVELEKRIFLFIGKSCNYVQLYKRWSYNFYIKIIVYKITNIKKRR